MSTTSLQQIEVIHRVNESWLVEWYWYSKKGTPQPSRAAARFCELLLFSVSLSSKPIKLDRETED